MSDRLLATFYGEAIFSRATFGHRKNSDEQGNGQDLSSPAVADFQFAHFSKPDLAWFITTNMDGKEGLRARLVGSNVEGLRIEAVNWYRHNGRMVLQDELDLVGGARHAGTHEEVAIAYRRLITNFEKARAYDLAEDCAIGEFEMKRRDPIRFPFAGVLGSFYERFPLLRRWIGEQVSAVGIYRLASVYGTSYHRALVMLGVLLLGFALVFATIIGIHPSPLNPGQTSTCGQSNAVEAFCAGLLHAMEVATLQREVLYKPDASLGRMVEVFEQIVIAGQAALLLFALRRRFRR